MVEVWWCVRLPGARPQSSLGWWSGQKVGTPGRSGRGLLGGGFLCVPWGRSQLRKELQGCVELLLHVFRRCQGGGVGADDSHEALVTDWKLDLYQSFVDAGLRVRDLFEELGLDGKPNARNSVFIFRLSFPEEGVTARFYHWSLIGQPGFTFKAAISKLYLDSLLAMRADLLWGLVWLQSRRVRMFQVPRTRFSFIFCWKRPQVGKSTSRGKVGQAFFRSPFLDPFLTRVSSAILKRLLRHLSCCRSSSLPFLRNSDQRPRPPTCRFLTMTSSGYLHLSLSPFSRRLKAWVLMWAGFTNYLCVKYIKVGESLHEDNSTLSTEEIEVHWHGEPLRLETSLLQWMTRTPFVSCSAHSAPQRLL